MDLMLLLDLKDKENLNTAKLILEKFGLKEKHHYMVKTENKIKLSTDILGKLALFALLTELSQEIDFISIYATSPSGNITSQIVMKPSKRKDEMIFTKEIKTLESFLFKVKELYGDTTITFRNELSEEKRKQIEQIIILSRKLPRPSEISFDWEDERTLTADAMVDYVTQVRKNVWKKDKLFPVLDKIQMVAEMESIHLGVGASLDWFLTNSKRVKEIEDIPIIRFERELQEDEIEKIKEILEKAGEEIDDIGYNILTLYYGDRKTLKTLSEINKIVPIDTLSIGVTIRI